MLFAEIGTHEPECDWLYEHNETAGRFNTIAALKTGFLDSKALDEHGQFIQSFEFDGVIRKQQVSR